MNGYYVATTTAYISSITDFEGLASAYGDIQYGKKYFYFNLETPSWFTNGTNFNAEVRFKNTNTALANNGSSNIIFNSAGSGSGNCSLTTTLNELRNQNNILSVYPNPANEMISIEYKNSNAEVEKIVIKNLLGQRVIVSKTLTNIDIKELSLGNYIIKVVGKNNQVLASAKFIKE